MNRPSEDDLKRMEERWNLYGDDEDIVIAKSDLVWLIAEIRKLRGTQ